MAVQFALDDDSPVVAPSLNLFVCGEAFSQEFRHSPNPTDYMTTKMGNLRE